MLDAIKWLSEQQTPGGLVCGLGEAVGWQGVSSPLQPWRLCAIGWGHRCAISAPPTPTPVRPHTTRPRPTPPCRESGSVFGLDVVKRMLLSSNPPSVLH